MESEDMPWRCGPERKETRGAVREPAFGNLLSLTMPSYTTAAICAGGEGGRALQAAKPPHNIRVSTRTPLCTHSNDPRGKAGVLPAQRAAPSGDWHVHLSRWEYTP